MAALATLLRQGPTPFVSLVTIATEADGTPLMLLSDLAVHTRNIKANARASILIDERAATMSAGDPLTGVRATLVGQIERIEHARARRRFLARQQEAELYADFADFSFYRLQVETAHLVAGFGRIAELSTCDVLIDLTDAEEIVSSETEILAHLNEEHADALRLFATRLLGSVDGDWRAIGIDPEGLDLQLSRESETHSRRLAFPTLVRNSGTLRAILKNLAETAHGDFSI